MIRPTDNTRDFNSLNLFNHKMDRREFLAGSITAIGIGVGTISLAGCALQPVKTSKAVKDRTEMKYEVRNIRVLAENGGQTDWAKHDLELIT